MSTEAQPITPAPLVAGEVKNVEDPCKVFAGNLAFSTTDADVKELFSVAGTVTEVSLITRGTRSLGYGFVTFSTEAEAKKAVETLNKKEVGGREINVEGARPQNALPANGLKKKSNNKKKAAGARARRPRNEQGEEGGETAGESAAEGVTEEVNGESKSAKRRNKKKTSAAKKALEGEAVEGEVPAEGAAAKAKKPAAKRPLRPKVAPTGEPSKTLLFVSNLSFSIDDEKLKGIFSDYKVKSATVVKQKFGNQRSKGFAFVDFETEEDQQKALANEQGRSVEERAIQVKVALQDNKKDDETKPAEETAANPAVETPLA